MPPIIEETESLLTIPGMQSQVAHHRAHGLVGSRAGLGRRARGRRRLGLRDVAPGAAALGGGVWLLR